MPHTFLLSVSKGDADWLRGFDVFRVELSIQQVVKYVDIMNEVTRLQRRHPEWNIYEFQIWDYSGAWLSGNCDVEMIHDAEGTEIPPPDLEQDEDASRTELDMAHVGPDGIVWTANPKHSDREVSTGTLNRDLLEEIIRHAALQTAEKGT